MIDYNLALELKNTGFPHDWTEFDDHDPELLEANWDMYGKGYCPDLEEVIAELGNKFGTLSKYSNGWTAKGGRSDQRDGYQYEAEGKTPFEAACRLWLVIKSKQ